MKSATLTAFAALPTRRASPCERPGGTDMSPPGRPKRGTAVRGKEGCE